LRQFATPTREDSSIKGARRPIKCCCTIEQVVLPTGVPRGKIAFAKEGAKITPLTVADPNVMLTARRE
jgi:hypothetical protein